MRVTRDNLHQFPRGTKVNFFWGRPVDTGGGDWDDDMLQEEDGTVIGYAAKPATKFFPELVELLVETESGRVLHVSHFVTCGVGARLI